MNVEDIMAVVVSYNGRESTRRTVLALSGQVGHIHIVDNGSEADSLDHANHWDGLGRVGIADCFGQIDLHRVREQRRGDDENHQQHQHHVDQRHHVDLRHRRGVAAFRESAESHIRRLPSPARHGV